MNLDEIQFEMTTLLGRAEIPMRAYLGLQIGDILVLDQTIEEGLAVRVGEEERYRVSAGLLETHKAIRIDERVHP